MLQCVHNISYVSLFNGISHMMAHAIYTICYKGPSRGCLDDQLVSYLGSLFGFEAIKQY